MNIFDYNDKWLKDQKEIDRLLKLQKESSEKCLWDYMPDHGSEFKIGHLSCPCKKCSPRS